MASINKNKRGLWTEEQLQNAVTAVKETNLSVNRASLEYKIPRRTLRRILAKDGEIKKKALGRPPVLNQKEEQNLKNRIVRLQQVGFGLKRQDLKKCVFQYCEEIGIHPFKIEKEEAGKYWLKGFMMRNPDIVSRSSENLSYGRLMRFNKKIRLPYTYRGFIVPVFTPFNSDGSLNLNIIPQYATYLAKKGIKGILVNGTSGEGTSMSIAERKLVTEAWVKATKETKQHLMVQVGGAPLPDVIELVKHASKLNVDSMLCLPELYFKPATPEQLIEYLEIVGKAAPETPLLYYHIPMMTGVNIHMGQFLELIGDKIPSFVGIKFTSANLEEGAQALRANDRKYVIFLGNDQLINAGCALGMDSFIVTSLNMFPDLVLDVLALCKNGDMLRSKDMQEKLSSSVIAITKHGNWVQTMKKAMALVTDINVGVPRAPLKSISPEAVTIMIKDLENLWQRPKV
ncbi:PREDICTED: N-acetylneuraminate lyase-like isoform X2 [Vollenhovia emeryi]|uniref:N-acetylneuraminate lyase-like isoform X2 n=1 Tax=Vollenhovia emeryi TaxID=411798 RepID=UPI0005F469F2|nr:PREDICTED: N-acetylneuraminate lyase-like isoform X2 [Vollenhovia emeryi]